MKKTYLLWFALWAFLLIGCRQDHFNNSEATDNQQALKFRVIPKSEIPQIISSLQSKTDNFKVPLKNHSATGKTETIFGDIITDFVIETNNYSESYYVFTINPNNITDETKFYNLEVKSDDVLMNEAKVVIYTPTEEWLASGNGDFSDYSGYIDTYTLDGSQEASVSYLNGSGTCLPPEPCPDCPTTPNGPTGGGEHGPVNTPGTGGPVSYPNNDGGSGPSCGGYTFSHYNYYQNPVTGVQVITGEVWINACGEEYTVRYGYKTADKTDCSNGGSGGVIIPSITDPCTKTKSQLGTASVKEVIQNLKTHISSGAGGEKGYGIKKNGTASPTTENSDHSVNFGDPSLLTGGYHNHTGTKVDIFSAKDISTLIEIARYNGSSNPTNAFMGLIAPNGIHYLIRFNGLQTDLPPFNSFSDVQKEIWNIEQAIQKNDLLSENQFTQTINGKKILNFKGLEKILFDTLEKMGLKDKVVVQKMDDNNNVSIVIQNPDKSTTPISCP